MNRTIARLAATAAALLVLAVATPGSHAAGRSRDEVFRHASLQAAPPAIVAVLPVVGIADDPDTEHAVEERWVELYRTAQTNWVSADDVRAQLPAGTADPEAFALEMERQVWRDAEVNPETARRLASMLGVDALLSVRIDRWEIADGGRAMVAMTATLSSADGVRLWRISGLAGFGRGRDSSMPVLLPGSPRGSFAIYRSPLPRGERQHRLDKALYTLLARWAWSLPAPPWDDAEPQPAQPLLAGQPQETIR